MIRNAVIEDARAIAAIHVQTWQAAYAGIVPADYLASLSVEDRTLFWQRQLTAKSDVVLVAEMDGKLVGWASGGPSRDADANGESEVYAIYVSPVSWSRTIGRQLLTALEEAIGSRSGFTLWVLAQNQRAISFYQKLGYLGDGATKECTIGGVTLTELRFRKKPIPGRTCIALTPESQLTSKANTVLTRLRVEIEQLLPGAEIHHIGGTAIPGAVTKGDVDVVVRVTAGEFPTAVAQLKNRFEVKQPQNWLPDFASFGDDTGYALPLGVQLVVRDSENDVFLFLRDHLIQNPEALVAYNRLKTEHAGERSGGYWKAKHDFFAAILAKRAAKNAAAV